MNNKFLRRALLCALLPMTMVAAQTADTNHVGTRYPGNSVARLVARLTTLLSLTSDQRAKATEYFTTEANAIAKIRTSLATARAALKTAIEKNDTAAIGTYSTQIGTLLGQQTEAYAVAEAEFYAILTPEQQTKYQQLLSEGFGGFRGHGFRGYDF